MAICKFNQNRFCKYLSHCRNQHVNENCQEIKCENKSCPKRHPKTCKFFQLYNRCKFGEYCAFAHVENPLLVEIKNMKIKHATLEYEMNEKNNEILDLKVKVEVLEDIMNEVVMRVENITTPTKKGTKKRRRVRQTVTPSPADKADDELDREHPQIEEVHGPGVESQTDQESEKELTAEEILALYDSGQE